MRKFRIYFEANGLEDSFVIQGETIEDIRNLTKIETDRRGLCPDKNNCWSAEIF